MDLGPYHIPVKLRVPMQSRWIPSSLGPEKDTPAWYVATPSFVEGGDLPYMGVQFCLYFRPRDPGTRAAWPRRLRLWMRRRFPRGRRRIEASVTGRVRSLIVLFDRELEPRYLVLDRKPVQWTPRLALVGDGAPFSLAERGDDEAELVVQRYEPTPNFPVVGVHGGVMEPETPPLVWPPHRGRLRRKRRRAGALDERLTPRISNPGARPRTGLALSRSICAA